MVERRIELDRRYHRKKKMRLLKAKLLTASGEDREKLLYKIKRLSPFWTEEALKQSQTPAKAAAEETPKRKTTAKKKT
jgi:hypothetical protein